MAPVINGLQRGATYIEDRIKDFLLALRARWRWFDHLGRGYDRYRTFRGDRLAAALSFYGFLSFFPLVALAFAVTGYAVAISSDLRDYLNSAITQLLPGLAGRLPVQQIASAKAGAGVFGLLGLTWTGLNWIGVLRESIRIIWTGHPGDEANAVVRKFCDLSVLLILGLTVLASVALSGFAGTTVHAALRWIGLEGVPGAGAFLRTVAFLIALGTDVFIFLVLFTRLSGTRAPWRSLLRGCLFGAVGFELLKLVAAYLITHVVTNPLYASFAVLVGLLIWINVVSRYILYIAGWTATRRVVLRADRHPEDVA